MIAIRGARPRPDHGAAGEDHVIGAPLSDDPGQAHRAAINQRHAPAAAEHTEHGAARRHAHVAPDRQFKPAGHRVALDRRDHRFGQHQARGPHRAHDWLGARVPPLRRDIDRVQPVLPDTRRGGLEIEPGAKRACLAGEDRRIHRVIPVKGKEGFEQGACGLRVNRIARSRARDRHHTCAPCRVKPYCHARPSRCDTSTPWPVSAIGTRRRLTGPKRRSRRGPWKTLKNRSPT